MAWNETLTRTAVAVVGVPIAVAAVYFGGWVLAVLLAVAAAASAREFFRMAGRKDVRALSALGVAGSVALVVAASLAPSDGLDTPLPAWILVALILAASTLAIWTRGVEGEPVLSVSVTVFGAAYASLIGFGLFLRHLPGVEGAWHGSAILLAPVVLTWISDTFAYFSGRLFGKRKLIPRVSPGKTVAGAVGAVLGTTLAGAAYALVLARFPAYRPGIAEMAAFGLVVSVVAQVGDLAESLFKRDTGVKDSGALFPGHGGALDRFDSLFFTLPLGYAFFRFAVGV